ncbi:MAG: fumarylacetoacetate hydrolase family protein [Bacteroidota bacterium]|nr:fumarylacetoacetate hydrolase family protein [Bacteroidota bacterium]
MKIICIGRNYDAHIKELQNETPEDPIIFLKPDTARLTDNKDFILPPWSDDMHYELELILKIGKNGKFIPEKFAYKYISAYSVGIDFTARDVQSKLKAKGLPWELSKAFDNSAVTGTWIEVNDGNDLPDNIEFCLKINNELKQLGKTANMIYSWPKIIEFISQYFTLRQGDIIYTGTPQGVGKIHSGDKLAGYIEEKELFNFLVK